MQFSISVALPIFLHQILEYSQLPEVLEVLQVVVFILSAQSPVTCTSVMIIVVNVRGKRAAPHDSISRQDKLGESRCSKISSLIQEYECRSLYEQECY